MDQFVSEYLDVLGRVHAAENLPVLQEWCFAQKKKLHTIVPAMNAKMRLEKYKNPESYRFWELVPMVAGGSPKEFIILSAEPHAGPQGKRAHEWCTDQEHYLKYARRFFEYCREAEGDYSDWWTRALFFIHRLVQARTYKDVGDPELGEWSWCPKYSSKQEAEIWEWAAECDTIGGWELFPLWSGMDAFSHEVIAQARTEDWAFQCARASLMTALSLRPRVLFIASRVGHRLITDFLLPGAMWHPKRAPIGRNVYSASSIKHEQGGSTVIFALSNQIFSNASPKKFKPAELINVMGQCGIDYSTRARSCP